VPRPVGDFPVALRRQNGAQHGDIRSQRQRVGVVLVHVPEDLCQPVIAKFIDQIGNMALDNTVQDFLGQGFILKAALKGAQFLARGQLVDVVTHDSFPCYFENGGQPIARLKVTAFFQKGRNHSQLNNDPLDIEQITCHALPSNTIQTAHQTGGCAFQRAQLLMIKFHFKLPPVMTIKRPAMFGQTLCCQRSLRIKRRVPIVTPS
jgi:hypothetical protein